MPAKKPLDLDNLTDLWGEVAQAEKLLNHVVSTLAKFTTRVNAKTTKKVGRVAKKASRVAKAAKPGRKPGKTAQKGAKRASKAANRAEIKGGAKRGYTVFSPQQKEAQRKLIYQTVAGNEKEVTTPDIIERVTKAYPEINESVVRNIVKDLVSKRHLRCLQKQSSRTIHYAIGPEPL
jgi:catalase